MARINILPTHLVNKIAAGEVIERPASVVKELAENAIDAGATRIHITLEDGGRKLITVADNGCGMEADDAAMAFLPHATSKIVGDDDLFNIHTMGFRGEALASIASISHAHLRTRRADSDSGWEVTASGDTVGEVRPAATAPGTTITVGELFFNTPARRKFMRTANTEMGHVSEQVTRLALPHPHIAFTLTHNGRRTLNLSATDSTRKRIADIFGADLADCLLPMTAGRDSLAVDGLISPPAAARGSSKWQYVFLNGRYIRDRLLSHAFREAYRGLVDPNRWPIVFAFIQIDPDCVDINVHPTKIEVRFRDSQAVHSALLGAMRKALNRQSLTVPASPGRLSAAPGEDNATDQARRQSLRQAMADFFKSAPKSPPPLKFPDDLALPPQTASGTVAGAPPGSPFRLRPTVGEPRFGARPATSRHETAQIDTAGSGPCQRLPAVAAEDQPSQVGRPVFQLDNTYIVAATDDGLIIVDQHALHERILYNELKRRLTDGALTGQLMLIPQTITVTEAEADLLASASELLGRLGIVVEPFGLKSMAVQQFPTMLAERGVAADDFIRSVVDALAEDETADAERLLERLLELIACKSAIKAGDSLTDEEMSELLRGRTMAEKGSACPHGRPTTLELTLADLQRQFNRT